MQLIDETGNRYGRWTVVERVKNSKDGQARWLCACDCGKTVQVRGTDLRSGVSRSCGCLQREVCAARATIHGLHGTPEYNSWTTMIQRCTNPNSPNFSHYGGRGIKICESWLASFEAFYYDMGERPTPKYTLDRINNDGNYMPGNCRWATMKQQMRNMCRNRILTHDSQTLCVTDWAKKLGMNSSTLRNRLYRGWSVERALTQPVGGA